MRIGTDRIGILIIKGRKPIFCDIDQYGLYIGWNIIVRKFGLMFYIRLPKRKGGNKMRASAKLGKLQWYRIVPGNVARELNLYYDEHFIPQWAEKNYDNGIWLIPRKGYATWYGSFDALYRAMQDEAAILYK